MAVEIDRATARRMVWHGQEKPGGSWSGTASQQQHELAGQPRCTRRCWVCMLKTREQTLVNARMPPKAKPRQWRLRLRGRGVRRRQP